MKNLKSDFINRISNLKIGDPAKKKQLNLEQYHPYLNLKGNELY